MIKLVSFAVRRGAPTAAQRHLDSLLAALSAPPAPTAPTAPTAPSAPPPPPLPLPDIIYRCVRAHPDDVLMINGSSGESFTNEQVVRRAVRLSRALLRRFPCDGQAGHGPRDVTLLCVMRNHEHLLALYYAALFAGVKVFLLDPLSTQYELIHFLRLVRPALVACDANRRPDLMAAVEAAGGADSAGGVGGVGGVGGALGDGDVIAHDRLDAFAAGEDDDLDSFQPSRGGGAGGAGVLLPTSGSTGLPKAADISCDALVAHLPVLWVHHNTFPRPEATAMFLSTAEWMTFTMLLTSCPVYRVTMLISPDKSLPTAIRMIETFKPTWLLLVPGTAVALVDNARPEQLASLRTVVVTGAPPASRTLQALRAGGAHVGNGYGMTEASGFVALPAPDAPLGSIGQVVNIFDYKLIDDDGKNVKLGEKGELCIKDDWIIKRYVNNEEAYRECVLEGGWWRTGDVFVEDHRRFLSFVERKKFWFKYFNYQISPEQIEAVISGVPGVAEVVVCAGNAEGAAAAAVVRANGEAGCRLTKEQIHHAVNDSIIEYKRLRAGIVFVESLPRTHSGKLHRINCTRLVQALVQKGECS